MLIVTLLSNVLVTNLVTTAHCVSCKKSWSYDSCPQLDNNVLNVHIVPHSHLDVGWVHTPEEYFHNLANGVDIIMRSVVEALLLNPSRRFIFAEMYYFSKWWDRQQDSLRHQVSSLVRHGRLQVVGGGWTMNDEGTTSYQQIVDHYSLGLRKLNKMFGLCALPRVAWQIDPFGHSREFPSLLLDMGYEGVILGRVHHEEQTFRQENGSMDMMWRVRDDDESSIFTSILFDGYSYPNVIANYLGYNAPSEEKRDLSKVEKYLEDNNETMESDDIYTTYTQENMDNFVDQLFKLIDDKAKGYSSNNILIPCGNDFTYWDAPQIFRGLDKFIEYANWKANATGRKFNLFYSTPQCYVKAVKESKVQLTYKNGDFFPYASLDHGYWTGFFTSRPSLKYFEREGNNYLQMAKQLLILGGLNRSLLYYPLESLKNAMGVLQHHDAITGTATQEVTQYYVRILNNGIEDSLDIVRKVLNKYINNDKSKWSLDLDRCPLNESSCPASEQSRAFVVTVYNQLAWAVTEPVRIPVLEGNYTVYAPDGQKISAQLVEIHKAVINLPTRRSIATHEVVFLAHLAPLSFKSFYFTRNEEGYDCQGNKIKEENDTLPIWVTPPKPFKYDWLTKLDSLRAIGGKGKANYFIEAKDNEFQKVFNDILLARKSRLEFNVKFEYYTNDEKQKPYFRMSGAYLFQPSNEKAVSANPSFVKGPTGEIVKEITTLSNSGAASTVRIYNGLKFIENDWVIGPIDVTDTVGKEYVVKYETGVRNVGEFYTDSNGRAMMERRVNEMFDFDIRSTRHRQLHFISNASVQEIDPLPRSANFYPVANRIGINDSKLRITVLTDRAEGGTSIEDGNIELMLHRRLLHDDGLGVNEALDETYNTQGLVVRGRHRILLSHSNTPEDLAEEKRQSIQFQLLPQVFVTDTECFSLTEWKLLTNEFSWLKYLPEGIHLLTLDTWVDNTVLLRLENYLQTDKTHLEVDLNDIFLNLQFESFKETALAGFLSTEDIKGRKKVDKAKNKIGLDGDENEQVFHNGFIVAIEAKEIKTYVCKVKTE